MMLTNQAGVWMAAEKVQGLNGWLIGWRKDSLTSEIKRYLWQSLGGTVDAGRGAEGSSGRDGH